VGGKKLDLAEEVYRRFLNVRDLIGEIRSPIGYEGEGLTRKRGERETPFESEILDRAFVAVERYNNRKEEFNALDALRHRFTFYFGEDAAEPFNDLAAIMRDIFSASRTLRRSWLEQGRKEMTESEFEVHLKRMQDAEEKFWAMGEDDPLEPRIQKMISTIQEISRSTVNPKITICSLTANWWQSARLFFKCS